MKALLIHCLNEWLGACFTDGKLNRWGYLYLFACFDLNLWITQSLLTFLASFR